MYEMNITVAGVTKYPSPDWSLPPAEYVNAAVKELASKDNPRVIIVVNGLAVLAACQFYKYGLYGPDFVFLWPGEAYFNPNVYIRVPNCTAEMVAEVLKSVIFFSEGSSFALGLEEKDALGLLPSEYEQKLKAKLNHPEHVWSWFNWRRFCYSPVQVSSFILQNIDERLQEEYNDTIGNWVASGENFRRNASFIEEIFKEEFNRYQFEGRSLNKITSRTGFFQMQQIEGAKGYDASTFKAVAVASFDPETQTYQSHAPLKWRTFDGSAPFDRIHYVKIRLSLISTTNASILIALAVLIIMINLISSIVLGIKSKCQFSSIIAVGNVFSMLFVCCLIGSTMTRGKDSSSLGTIASVCLITGQFLANLSFAIKIQRAISQQKTVRRGQWKPNSNNESHLKSKTSVNSSVSVEKPSQRISGNHGLDTGSIHYFALFIFVLVEILTIIWFSWQPLTNVIVDIGEFPSKHHRSIVNVHFTEACHLPIESMVSKVFLGIVISIYGILQLRLLQLAIFARKITNEMFADIFHLKLSIGVSISVTFLGGLVTWLIYSANPADLYQAVAIIALIIVSSNTSFVIKSIVSLYRPCNIN